MYAAKIIVDNACYIGNYFVYKVQLYLNDNSGVLRPSIIVKLKPMQYNSFDRRFLLIFQEI